MLYIFCSGLLRAAPVPVSQKREPIVSYFPRLFYKNQKLNMFIRELLEHFLMFIRDKW